VVFSCGLSYLFFFFFFLIQKDGFNKRRSEGGGDKNAIFMGKEKKALTLHHQQYGDVQEGDPETDRRGRAP